MSMNNGIPWSYYVSFFAVVNLMQIFDLNIIEVLLKAGVKVFSKSTMLMDGAVDALEKFIKVLTEEEVDEEEDAIDLLFLIRLGKDLVFSILILAVEMILLISVFKLARKAVKRLKKFRKTESVSVLYDKDQLLILSLKSVESQNEPSTSPRLMQVGRSPDLCDAAENDDAVERKTDLLAGEELAMTIVTQAGKQRSIANHKVPATRLAITQKVSATPSGGSIEHMLSQDSLQEKLENSANFNPTSSDENTQVLSSQPERWERLVPSGTRRMVSSGTHHKQKYMLETIQEEASESRAAKSETHFVSRKAKRFSLSRSKIVITSYPATDQSVTSIKSDDATEKSLRKHYRSLLESLNISESDIDSLKGPTEQDWEKYYEQEKHRKSQKKIRTEGSVKFSEKSKQSLKLSRRSGEQDSRRVDAKSIPVQTPRPRSKLIPPRASSQTSKRKVNEQKSVKFARQVSPSHEFARGDGPDSATCKTTREVSNVCYRESKLDPPSASIRSPIKSRSRKYYQNLLNTLNISETEIDSLKGPTEQDWMDYYELEKGLCVAARTPIMNSLMERVKENPTYMEPWLMKVVDENNNKTSVCDAQLMEDCLFSEQIQEYEVENVDGTWETYHCPVLREQWKN